MVVNQDIIHLTFVSSSRVLWRTYVGFEKAGVKLIGISPPDNSTEFVTRSLWMKNDHTSRLTIPLLTSSHLMSKVYHEIVPSTSLGTLVSCKKLGDVRTIFQLLSHIKTFGKRYSKHRNNKINIQAVSTPSSDNFPGFYITF